LSGLWIWYVIICSGATSLLNEQNSISQKIETIDKKIELEQTTLNKYQKLKQGLMQDLLTGKVKVSLTPAANE
jgi:type I restriction enzyme S subunit